MIKIKMLYNEEYIDNIEMFDNKIDSLKNKYREKFNIEKSNKIKFDLIINDKIVYTLEDNFSIDPVSTEMIIKKIDQHIYNVTSSRNTKDISKFDDVDIIDY